MTSDLPVSESGVPGVPVGLAVLVLRRRLDDPFHPVIGVGRFSRTGLSPGSPSPDPTLDRSR